MTEFTKQELVDILRDDSQNDWLFSLADKVRQENTGDEIHLRGLIEFSNYCKNTCKYCGYSEKCVKNTCNQSCQATR